MSRGLSPRAGHVRRFCENMRTKEDAMRYLLQIYSAGMIDVFERLPADEQEAIREELRAVERLPGVVGAARLQPVETATTVRVENGAGAAHRRPVRRREGTRRRLLPRRGGRSRRGDRRSPRGSRPRGWAARSRCARWWRGSPARAGLPRRVGPRPRQPGRLPASTSTWPRKRRRRRSRPPPSAGRATAPRPIPAPG